jgi:hypothetical protein
LLALDHSFTKCVGDLKWKFADFIFIHY